MVEKFHYQCSDCKAEYVAGKVMYLCPACQPGNTDHQPPRGVLKTIYNYKSIRENHSGPGLFSYLQKENFLSLLPINNLASMPMLRVGNTPIYRKQVINQIGKPIDIFLKDDSQNPTFSFKDRASALVSAWARENNIGTIVTASTGNAGSSLAGICAAQGQKSVIFVPSTAPLEKLTQIMMYGARIVPVDGSYDQAFDLSVKASEMFGFYNRNTAFNPLTIEGKKTVSFELFGQLSGQIPDRIFVPVGDGVIISGVYKGFEDLLELGIIDHMPVIVAVQAEGSNNLIRNINSKSFASTPSNSVADSISVDIPRNFYMAAGFLNTYYGETIQVTDEEILNASLSLARSTGIFSEPASAAAYAGLLKYNSGNMLPVGTKNVVLLTGSGLKDIKSVQSVTVLPEPVAPDPGLLHNFFINKP